jgi:hypothetical protein
MSSATDVVLSVSVRKGRLYADMTRGPILRYCPVCQHLSRTPYPYSGSRYGQVGSFTCERCGAEVVLIDGDCRPPIQYSVSSRAGAHETRSGVTIWHEDLYGVLPEDFRRIERWTGLNFFDGVRAATLPFHAIMERLEAWVAQRGGALTEPLDATRWGEWMELVFGDGSARRGGLRPHELPQPYISVIPEPFRRWLALYCTAYVHAIHE